MSIYIHTYMHAYIYTHRHTIPYHTIPYHTIPYHTIPSHPIPSHPIPSHPIHSIPFHSITLHYITLRYIQSNILWCCNKAVRTLVTVKLGLGGGILHYNLVRKSNTSCSQFFRPPSQALSGSRACQEISDCPYFHGPVPIHPSVGSPPWLVPCYQRQTTERLSTEISRKNHPMVAQLCCSGREGVRAACSSDLLLASTVSACVGFLLSYRSFENVVSGAPRFKL